MKTMKAVDVFSIGELRQGNNDLIRDVESGRLALITVNGNPKMLAIPFNQELLENGVNRSLALHLFKAELLTLTQAAKLASLTLYDFLDLIKYTDINVVNYSSTELDEELEAGR
jgi:predicted HTH domain antitoxin